MMILDAHSHLGEDVVFDCVHTEEDLSENNQKYGITGGIVQPFIGRPYLEITRQYHNRVSDFCRKYKNYWGMASINPHFTPKDYASEAERCIKELGFVGLKLTPAGHAVDPESKDALFVFENARKLQVPVMVHTGYGIPFADPVKLKKAAMRYPDVKMIIAHLGNGFFADQAIQLALEFEQVYLEPSGCGIGETYKALCALEGKKVMFSSDSPLQIPTELAKYNTILERHPQWKEDIFHKTAERVFGVRPESFAG
ncbi:amidohydrolase family protein [Lachnospiraceae bacterium 38-10]